MKPLIATIALMFTAAMIAWGQITISTTPHWTLPTVSLSGADAQTAFTEMCGAVDAQGNKLVPLASLIPGEFYVVVHGTLDANTNCVSLSIDAHSAQ